MDFLKVGAQAEIDAPHLAKPEAAELEAAAIPADLDPIPEQIETPEPRAPRKSDKAAATIQAEREALAASGIREARQAEAAEPPQIEIETEHQSQEQVERTLEKRHGRQTLHLEPTATPPPKQGRLF